MIVYQYDHDGFLLGPDVADPSPLEPGTFLIPARCTTTPPPANVPDGHAPRWDGANWQLVSLAPPPEPGPPAPPVPTPQDARRERDRRIALGTTVTVTGIGDVPIQGRAADMRNLQGLATVAQTLLAAGSTDTLRFRDADNTMHDLTPAQMIALFTGGAAFIEACHAVVWAWADGPGVPDDFTDPAHWP